MEFQEFIQIIARKKQTIAVVTIVFTLIAVIFTFVQPLKFSADSKLLVMQSSPGGDYYQVSKSNEHVAGLLTQVISTNSFYNEVMAAGFNIDKSYFPESGKKLSKMWKQTLRASADANGIISIHAYHSNRAQANELAKAVDYVLETKHTSYHGFGDAVTVKVIEQPLTSDLPVKPNIFINISFAIVFAILASLSYIYLFPERDYDLRFVQAEQPANYPRYRADMRREMAQEGRQLMAEYVSRRSADIPARLPFAEDDNADNYDRQSLPNAAAHRAGNTFLRGSMDNILKQPDQRG